MKSNDNDNENDNDNYNDNEDPGEETNMSEISQTEHSLDAIDLADGIEHVCTLCNITSRSASYFYIHMQKHKQQVQEILNDEPSKVAPEETTDTMTTTDTKVAPEETTMDTTDTTDNKDCSMCITAKTQEKPQHRCRKCKIPVCSLFCSKQDPEFTKMK